MVESNGAGKTTLLRTIVGQLRPIKGSIEFLGERLDGLQTNSITEKGLSLVPEDGAFFPDMSIIDSLKMGAYTPKARTN